MFFHFTKNRGRFNRMIILKRINCLEWVPLWGCLYVFADLAGKVFEILGLLLMCGNMYYLLIV